MSTLPGSHLVPERPDAGPATATAPDRSHASSGAAPTWLKWGLFVGFWTLVGLFFSSQYYLSSFKTGRPIPWARAVTFSLGDWYVWGVLSIPVIWLTRRLPLDLKHWPQHLPVHLAACLAAAYAHMALRAWLTQLQRWLGDVPVAFGEAFAPLFLQFFYLNLVVYWVIVAASQAWQFHQRSQERERRAAELEHRLTHARLQALQMQLNPHFLFNTLHAISALMHQDVEAADRMIVRLSELLRYALDSTDAQEVPLRQELDFLERYLAIEQTRFGDRLRVHLDVAPETLGAAVPNLLLQPLVENSIRHGIEVQTTPGRLELRARRDADRLVLEVADNGPGLVAGRIPEERVGLGNTRARLEQLYGAGQQLDFHPSPSGGLTVRVQLPFRRLPDAPSPAPHV